MPRAKKRDPNLDNIRGMADELGAVRAQMSELKGKEKTLRDAIKDSGIDVLEDELFRAVRVEQHKTLVDWRTIAERLKPSPQLVRAHTTHRTDVSIRTNSRTGEGVKPS